MEALEGIEPIHTIAAKYQAHKGMVYCHTIWPPRTMNMDCLSGLRVSYSPA